MSATSDASDHGARIAIERLRVGDGARLRSLRLRALQDAPEAFEATYAQAAARPPETWDSQLDRLATFVATADGRDVGLVRGTQHEHAQDAGYLISMWVAPEARGQGVGAALVRAVVAWARGVGWQRLLLDVRESNIAAIALYAREGFIADGDVQVPSAPGPLREIQMARRL